jgi:NAD(P)-dependent dehydrogenase (short-subunit alcohol dehydrogenase family)
VRTCLLVLRTDVADAGSVQSLADAVRQRFGRVHVLCNNAGVAGGGRGALWETSERDWAWVLGVNLMGVVHGLQAFVPQMLAHGEDGHIVNTSSVLGLSTGPGFVYGVSKHAVTRLTEGLYYELRARQSRIGVSVLCPGLVATRIVTAERNRPGALRNPGGADLEDEVRQRREQVQQRFREHGMPPDRVSALVLKAIREDRFYILTHPGVKQRVETRMKDILEERRPSPFTPEAGFGGSQ